MGHNIFISYRRVDTAGYAGRIYDRLAKRFGSERVFMDVTDIGVGADFADAIGQAIGSCRVVIVLMGPRWHTILDEMGRARRRYHRYHKKSAGSSFYGSYNMSGNGAEWVKDWFQAYSGGDPNAAKDFGITHRTIRGGAYFDGPKKYKGDCSKRNETRRGSQIFGFSLCHRC